MSRAEPSGNRSAFLFLVATCFGQLRATIVDMLTPQLFEETIANLTQVNAALRTEGDDLRATCEATFSEYTALNSQYLRSLRRPHSMSVASAFIDKKRSRRCQPSVLRC